MKSIARFSDLKTLPKEIKVIYNGNPILHKPLPSFQGPWDPNGLAVLKDRLFSAISKITPGLPTTYGFAAPQMGVAERVFAMKTIDEKIHIMIDPEILEASNEKYVTLEGCLSIPKYMMKIKRPAEIKVKFWDEKGKIHTTGFRDFEAIVFQHELDHLEGKTLFDRVESTKEIIHADLLTCLEENPELIEMLKDCK